ncbi:AcrR family transcriptional regulator [Streptosporangium album]|uniref:AcrR family transcriptional regulator n=1 Tax=Streptosporangium album TaxID=47479 RepID=A0A7W7S5C4_9ACTN|nr:TetR/AcrR family transcriptional regulator [Streptosporangium album]MBB4944181.1 AcrR family transcriptional regulator [Streptosporangium album]
MTQRRTSGVATKPRANGEERWEEIVTAAAKIFSQKGYAATSLQDIASAVGILKGSMYHYIKNKEDLLFELVRRALDVQMPVLVEEASAGARSAPERLRSFIRRWMGFSRAQRLWSRVAENEFSQLSGKRYKEVVAERDKFSDFVKGIIEQGIREGAFDPATNPSVVTSSLFELMNSTPKWFKPSGDLSYGELAEWYATFVIRGIGGPDFRDRNGASLAEPNAEL